MERKRELSRNKITAYHYPHSNLHSILGFRLRGNDEGYERRKGQARK
jgi:hypothetical protein